MALALIPLTRKPGWTLSGRLSSWLAIQTFIGLLLVSVAVYVAFAFNLNARQAEAITEKQSILVRLLDQVRLERDLPNFRQKLDAFFAGHNDLMLEMYEQDGTLIYRNTAIRPDIKRVHATMFMLASPAGVFGDVTVQLSMDTRADDILLRRLAFTLAAVALLGSLLVSVSGFWLVRLGYTPVQKLVDQIDNLAANTLEKRLDGSDQPGELQPLVEQFNALLKRLHRAYEQMEGFNSDVAHELNTPLSTIITSTELALRKERDPEVLRDMMGSNLEDLHRMSGIVKDMLFLSHSERGAIARRTDVPSLAAVAFDVAEYHEAALSDALLQVKIQGDVSGEFDVPLIKRAMSNLLCNATRYAEPGSTVLIELMPRGAGVASVGVVNLGPAIGQEHLPRLFDRFYRADPARAQGETHHGLGLAIVAMIARLHGGEPFAHSTGGKTTVGIDMKTTA